MNIVHLRGTARERGRAHGEELRERIAEGLRRWRESLVAASGEADVGDYLDAFRAAGRFHTAVERWTPALAAEVAGIAEGAAADPDDVWAYQLMDEHWWFAERWRRDRQVSTDRAERCSSLAVHERGQPPIVAQNMDLPDVYDGSQVLLHIVDDERGAEMLVFSAAGLIGLDGLNRDGVAVCCNSLSTLPVSHEGLPVAFVIRGVLAERSLADAAMFLRRIHHATGQNYLIGDASGFLDLECWRDNAVEWSMSPRCVVHTNHPLAVPGRIDEAPAGSTTHERYGLLDARFNVDHSPVGVAEVKAALSTPPVSVARPPGHGWMTVGSLVMELADEPVLHLAAGPPATTPYASHRFS